MAGLIYLTDLSSPISEMYSHYIRKLSNTAGACEILVDYNMGWGTDRWLVKKNTQKTHNCY